MQVELEPEIQARLEKIAETDHRTVSFYAQEAIIRFREDCKDYVAGINSLERHSYTTSLEETERCDATEC